MALDMDTAKNLKPGDKVYLNQDQGDHKKGTEFTVTRVVPVPKVGKVYVTGTDPNNKVASFEAGMWDLEPAAGKKVAAAKAAPKQEEPEEVGYEPAYADVEGALADDFSDYAPPGELADAFFGALADVAGVDDTSLLDGAMSDADVARGTKWTETQIARMFSNFCKETGVDLPEVVLEFNKQHGKGAVAKPEPAAAPGEQPVKRGPGRPPKGESENRKLAALSEAPADRKPAKAAPVKSGEPADGAALRVAGAILTALSGVSDPAEVLNAALEVIQNGI